MGIYIVAEAIITMFIIVFGGLVFGWWVTRYLFKEDVTFRDFVKEIGDMFVILIKRLRS